ncbi:PREDICTED: B3 domain-containing protein REM20-like isoform X2 [Camelina sativa]|uniref:B3 domain-containing protein REM20-like isoform X2 n=1 Tax=Camelina sativa TaxID=90675 RepID=A0ABM0SMF9_CAMSA|nr:PREDICTED: B3 domain-containing protein REM20-like isoform X2 [Camelina sativa]
MVILSASSVVRAALDTQPRLPYNPNAPRKVKKNPNSNSFLPPPLPSPSPVISISVADLLKRPPSKELQPVEVDDTYMGYETWSPSPPKLEKPRSVFNAASLAFIGDSIYELYARRHFLFPPLSIEDYNDRVRAVVRAEAQRPISTLPSSLASYISMAEPEHDDDVLFPRFFKVFVSQTASESFAIPLSFIEFLADPLPNTAKLQGTGGRDWTVSMKKIRDGAYFTAGWSKFAQDHELVDGEFLTFVYDGNRTFEVSVFGRLGCKETRAEAETLELSGSSSDDSEEDEEPSMDVDYDISLGEDEEISQSLYPFEDEETESDAAAVFEGNVDVKALTNPHFPTTLKNRNNELIIPASVVRENELIFGDSVKYIDGEGTLVGLRGKWAVDTVCFKGWNRICRRNRLKKHQDTVECELLHDREKMVHSIRVHVIRGTA